MAGTIHARITWSGIYGAAATPDEAWSFGLSADSLGLSIADDDTFFTAMETLGPLLVQAYADNLPAAVQNNVRLTNVRVAHVGADGRTFRTGSGRILHADTPANVTGLTGNSVALPNQVALAVSLHSASDHPTGRGRFFLPTPYVANLDASGRITDTVRDARRANVVEFLRDVQGVVAAGWDGQLVIASGGSSKDGIPAGNRPVLAVTVGRRLDVQRRRANDLVEDREEPTPLA